MEADVLQQFSDEVHVVDPQNDPESSTVFQKILL
jgi:hypothetical protein